MTGFDERVHAHVAVSGGTRQLVRDRMVDEQIQARGVKDQNVLESMRRVPRHRFVLNDSTDEAYQDYPLSIGYRQTISQPYIVALMTEALQLKTSDKVLEIGTGSGYQATVLAEIVSQVFSIEIVEALASRALNTLRNLGYDNVEVRAGDGYIGWAEKAPFNAIILTATPSQVPQPLMEQLAIGGRLIAPVGENLQSLVMIHRTPEGYTRTELLSVAFVPMTGQALKNISRP